MRRGSAGGRRKAGGARQRIRISAGKWKGRLLEVPPGARPTSSRAREALFDLLGPKIAGARILDLYAGSGAVGLEAVSRGAARAILVEAESGAIERSLARLGPAEGEVFVFGGRAADALDRLAASHEIFDIVFCDPPYAPDADAAIGEPLARVLAPGATVVFQRDARDPAPRAGPLAVRSRRAYGRNVFYFFARADPAGL